VATHRNLPSHNYTQLAGIVNAHSSVSARTGKCGDGGVVVSRCHRQAGRQRRGGILAEYGS